LDQAKPFSISKREVWESYKLVRANRGAAGIDGQSISAFEKNLANNLFKIWNRMSSGSYFPLAVRRVEIPKDTGGKRPLGIPTVSDRIAQMVVKRYLEPIVEACFHPDSYGYRPGKSALAAVAAARTRCWRNDWVLDLDIKGFFDNIDHDLLMRAVRHHTDCPWVLLYIERWLTVPVQLEDGAILTRNKGTPQGGVISPLLANLFLHYVFDVWMDRHYADIPFERYADDALCHCRCQNRARELKDALERRFADCKLELHPEKTKIIYCRDDDRRGPYPNYTFDFLGYGFRPRPSRNHRGKFFINFSPAISNKASKRIRQTLRRLRLHLRSDLTLDSLARILNPVVQGWINYFGRFYKSALSSSLRPIDRILARWASRKYKRLRGHQRKAFHWLGDIASRQVGLFAHWQFLHSRVGQ
jgi:group II intron reverse transcriptase/maturase